MTFPAAASLLHPCALFWRGSAVRHEEKVCGCTSVVCVCVWILNATWEYFYLLMLVFFARPPLSPCRRVLLLAAALWQYVLPPCSSASLYDPADDEWMFESKGKLAGVCGGDEWSTPLEVSIVFGCSPGLFLPFSPPLLPMLPSFFAFLSTLNSSLFSTSQQLGGDPQSWAEVYAVLKGTSLFCYHRQEDVEANIEPAFTIAINKVSKGKKKLSKTPSPKVDPASQNLYSCVVFQ